jgi:hypothetical protein
MPLFSLLFGEFTQAFGSYVPTCPGDAPLPPGFPGFMSNDEFRGLISGIALKFVYLAVGAGVMGALQQGCWTYTSNRQARQAAGRGRFGRQAAGGKSGRRRLSSSAPRP